MKYVNITRGIVRGVNLYKPVVGNTRHTFWQAVTALREVQFHRDSLVGRFFKP